MTEPLALNPLRPLRGRHLGLVRQLAAIQHGLLDQSTSLGYLWSFLHPLMMLAVLYLFFSRRIGEGIPHYGIYLLIGLVVFTHFSKSIAGAMRTLHRMRSLVTNIIFPKDLLVYSSLLADLPEFLISLAATVGIALATGVRPTAALLLLPVIAILEILLVLWLSLVLSATYVFVRDLDHIFEVVMRLMFFVTPIIYSVDILAPTSRRLASLNPLAHVIAFARTVILDGRLPATGWFVEFLLLNVALVYVAMLFFRRVEPGVVEQL